MLKKLKSYHYFLIVLFILLIHIICSYNFDETEVISINIHDTYFIISLLGIDIILSIILLISGFAYLILNKIKIALIKGLTKIHIFITIGSILCLEIGFFLFNTSNHKTVIFVILIVLIILTQLFLIFNIIISMFKYGLQRTTRQ